MLTSSTALFKTHITLWSAHEHTQYLPFYPDVAGGVLQSAVYIKKCRVYFARLPPSPRGVTSAALTSPLPSILNHTQRLLSSLTPVN